MKRILLAAALCAGSFMSAHAGYVMFQNMTGCNFSLNIDGTIANTGNFVTNGVLIPPGVTNYANPTLLPGVVQFGTGSLATGIIRVVKGYDVGGPYTFVVGNLPLPGLGLTYNSAVNSYYPACYGGSAYNVIFTANTNGDVVVLIF